MRAHVASKNNKLIRLRRIPVFLPSSLLWGIHRRSLIKHSKQGTELFNRLAKTGDRLVVIKNGSVLFSSRGPGIKPLLETIHGIPAAQLRCVRVADTVVGKAGALLLTYADAAFVASRVMSQIAMDTFREHKIPFYTKTVVPTILGRNADQQCPFELAVGDVANPRRACDVMTELAQALSPEEQQPKIQ